MAHFGEIPFVVVGNPVTITHLCPGEFDERDSFWSEARRKTPQELIRGITASWMRQGLVAPTHRKWRPEVTVFGNPETMTYLGARRSRRTLCLEPTERSVKELVSVYEVFCAEMARIDEAKRGRV